MRRALGGIVLYMIRIAILAIAAAPLIYYILSIYSVIDYFRGARKSKPKDSAFAPPASIIKAVRGVDREAYENFASYCRLDYPEYEILFAVADSSDPVVPVIEKLQRDFPNQQIRLLVGVPYIGTNKKVNSLCQLVQEAKYDLVVMSDSDVRVEPDYLRDVAAPFADTNVGGSPRSIAV